MNDLLTICQNVADAVGIEQPSTIIDDLSDTSRRLKSIASRSGRILAKKYNWVVLQNEHTFNTTAGTPDYDLPSDFARLIDSTTWDRANYWEQRGPSSPQDWQVVKSGLIASAQLRKRFRIKANARVNKFYIDPTPAAIEAQVYEYISNQWVTSSDNSNAYTDWNADTDVPLIDDLLIELDMSWRLKNQLGLAYLDDKKDFDDLLESVLGNDGGKAVLDIGTENVVISSVNIQDGNFG